MKKSKQRKVYLKDFWIAYKKGPFHICEVVCFLSIQCSQSSPFSCIMHGIHD